VFVFFLLLLVGLGWDLDGTTDGRKVSSERAEDKGTIK
jgi:hypothetical protein